MPKGLNLASKLMGIVLVLGFLVVVLPPDNYSSEWARSLGTWLAIYLLVAIPAIIEAGVLVKRGDLVALRRASRLVKLCSIPLLSLIGFFALIVLVGGFFFASLMAVGGILAMLSLALMPLFIGGAYLVMLPTSAYGIACLIQLRRTGAIGWPFFVVNLILHLLLVADVVSALLVAVRAQHGRVRPFRLVAWLAIAAVLVLVPFPAERAAPDFLVQVDQQRQQRIAKMAGVASVTDGTVVLKPTVTTQEAVAVFRKVVRLRITETSSTWNLNCGQASILVEHDDPEEPAMVLAAIGKAHLAQGTTVYVSSVAKGHDETVDVYASTDEVFGDAKELFRTIAAAEPDVRRTITEISLSKAHSISWHFRSSTWTRSTESIKLVRALVDLQTADLTVGSIDLEDPRSDSTVELKVHRSRSVAAACRAGKKVLTDHPEIELSVRVKKGSPTTCA